MSEMADALQAEMSRLGFVFFEKGSYNLNLIGLRSARDQSNLFDDTFTCSYKDDTGVWRCERWPYTSDPGRKYLLEPMNPRGCSILCAGQNRGAYQLGTHRGKPGLVQVRPVTFWVDSDLDETLDRQGTARTGLIGLNIHRAGKDSPVVEAHSAGCQTFKREDDFERLLDLVRKQIAKGPGWNSFSYTLIDIGDNPNLSPLAL